MKKFRLIASFILVGFMVLSGWMAYQRAKLYVAKFVEPSVKAAGADLKAVTPTVVSTTAEAPMAAAFESGRLPEPLPAPSGNPDQIAEELAKRVLAKDENSTSSLLTALRLSGFSVRAEDGSLEVESVKPGQGIVFDSWEVAAIAKLLSDGMQIKLVDLSSSLSSHITPLKDAPLTALLLDGLRAASQQTDPAKRFWACFIAELGRQSEEPYDLLAQNADPAKINLDAIQVSLILRRLVVDLMILDEDKSQRAQSLPNWERDGLPHLQQALWNSTRGNMPFVRDGVWHPVDGPSLTLVQNGIDSKLPCTLADLAAKIMDASASLSGKGFDKLIQYLEGHGVEGAGKYGKATSIINGLLAVIKLIAYFACLETDITMDGSPPLVRTQSIFQPGERRKLTASVRENIGKWQAMNCVRGALNAAGIEFSLPNDGPQEGVEIQWVLVGSGFSVSHDEGGPITWPFVQLVFPDGTPLIQDAMGATSNATAPKTDEEGHATIDIEGTKQREPLGQKVFPVMKQAEVRFTCAPKPISMSQDLIDAAGNGYLGGPVGLIVGGPVEILLRSNIHFSKPLLIPVKDWTSADVWVGTIKAWEKYEPSFPPNIINQPNYHSKSTRTEKLEATEVITLDGKTTPDGLFQLGSLTGSYSHTQSTEWSAQLQDDCHRPGSNGVIVTYTDEGYGNSSEEMTKASYKVVLGLTPFTDQAKGTVTYTVTTGFAPGDDAANNGIATGSSNDTKAGCGESKSTPWNPPTRTITANWPALPNFSAVADPKHPDVLVGHQDTPGDYSQHFEWDLHRPQ